MAKIGVEQIDCVLLNANLNGTSSAPIAEAVPFIIVTSYGALDLPTDAINNAPRLNKPFLDAELQNSLLGALAPVAT